MNRIFVMIAGMAMAIFLSGSLALGAGSSSMPSEDKRPGVKEYNAGVKLMQKGIFEKAEAKFRAAVKKKPDMADAYNNLGYSIRKQGRDRFADALNQYNRAIELKPALAEAYMYRGVLHMLMGNEDKALADHRSLTKLNRNLADSLRAAIASGEEPAGLDGLAKKW